MDFSMAIVVVDFEKLRMGLEGVREVDGWLFD